VTVWLKIRDTVAKSPCICGCGAEIYKEAAKKVEDGIEETLTYCDFSSEHWTRIRTNNVIERLNREIRRRTRVVGTFPDGNSALMLVCARLRHVAGTQWGNKKYMNMKHLEAALDDASIAG
jgi:putative transposase